MHRFYIEQPLKTSTQVMIQGKDARHISRVLRLKPGDCIEVCDGRHSLKARILSDSDRRVQLEILPGPLPLAESPVTLTIAQGFLKDGKMDMLVRHLTELGITGWIPFFAQRSVAVPGEKRLASRMDRWERIAREAMKQCRRDRLPEILLPRSLDQVLADAAGYDLRLILWENAKTPLSDIRDSRIPASGRILAILGPEGGFSKEEVHQARDAGCRVFSLGPRTLRAETATLATAALIQHLFGDLGA